MSQAKISIRAKKHAAPSESSSKWEKEIRSDHQLTYGRWRCHHVETKRSGLLASRLGLAPSRREQRKHRPHRVAHGQVRRSSPSYRDQGNEEAHAKEQKERWANDAADQTGLTPLMIASRNNNLEIILLLLEAGAQLGKVDTAKRWSALHWATCYASTETVGYLLKAGATRYLLDTEWRTVVDLASEYKRNIWQLLVAHHEIDRTPKKKPSTSLNRTTTTSRNARRRAASSDRGRRGGRELANANKSMFDGWKELFFGFYGSQVLHGQWGHENARQGQGHSQNRRKNDDDDDGDDSIDGGDAAADALAAQLDRVLATGRENSNGIVFVCTYMV